MGGAGLQRSIVIVEGRVDFSVLLETTHAVYPGGQQGCHSNGISPQFQKRHGSMYVCAVEQMVWVFALMG